MTEEVDLTILYDNSTKGDGLIPGWGFCALLERGEESILFDTGADRNVLRNNMEQLPIDKRPETIVLSHNHCDHVGGLSAVLSKDKNQSLHVPVGVSRGIESRARAYHAKTSVSKQITEVADEVYTTGSLPAFYRDLEFYEQGLLFVTTSGPCLISGCAHPGILEMLKQATDYLGESLFLTIGGFHLVDKKRAEIKRLISEMKPLTERVCPTHCTGEEATELFRASDEDGFVSGGVGEVIRM